MALYRTLPIICVCLVLIPAQAQDLDRELLLNQIISLPAHQPAPLTTLSKTSATTLPFRILIDVRSQYSDGAHDFQTLIQMAQKRHIDVLGFNEHDRFTIRLGLEPFPHLLHYSQEHPSLYAKGIKQFFHNLKYAQQQTSVTLIAGTESTPGYNWQGVPFKSLSLHNAERHVITVGVNQPAQIEALPSYQLTHAHGNKKLSLVFWFVFIFMLILMLMRKRKRSVALLLAGSFIAFITTWLIKPDINADTNFITTAKDQGLFTIWAHPGTLSGVRNGPMGVQLNTPPYNKYIFKHPADAFAAVYGDTDQNTLPGGLWDRYMTNYLRGYVAKPMWAVAAGDYHEEGHASEHLGNFPMDIWAKSTSQPDILEALRLGRMTAWHMGKDQNLSVHTLYIDAIDSASHQSKHLLSGDEASILPEVKLSVGIYDLGAVRKPLLLKGYWVVDGKVVAHVSLPTDKNSTLITALTLSEGRHVIRFRIPMQQGIRLETNPFLVHVHK